MIEREIFFKFYDEGSMPFPVAEQWFIRTLINMYFDVELNHICFEQLKPLLKEYYKELKDRLEMTTEEILNFSFSNNG